GHHGTLLVVLAIAVIQLIPANAADVPALPRRAARGKLRLEGAIPAWPVPMAVTRSLLSARRDGGFSDQDACQISEQISEQETADAVAGRPSSAPRCAVRCGDLRRSACGWRPRVAARGRSRTRSHRECGFVHGARESLRLAGAAASQPGRLARLAYCPE